MDEKISIVEKLGIDVLIAYPFDRKSCRYETRCVYKRYHCKQARSKVYCSRKRFFIWFRAAGNVTLLEESSETFGYKLRFF